MGKVIVSLTMSLDGFVAGANITPELPMGEGGERLHDWMFDKKTEADDQISSDRMKNSGAVILGNGMYADGVAGPWGGVNPFGLPAFVLAHQVPAKVPDGFTIVTDGIESAFKQAKVAAGNKDIWIAGGADVVQQYLKAGLVDELQISIAPVLFGTGTRLFDHIGTKHIELQNTLNLQTPQATHLRFNVVK